MTIKSQIVNTRVDNKIKKYTLQAIEDGSCKEFDEDVIKKHIKTKTIEIEGVALVNDKLVSTTEDTEKWGLKSFYSEYMGSTKLLPYQQATIDDIVEYFFESNINNRRAVLADEVGLGKTYIAKGIIGKMMQKHLAEQEKLDADKRRPFKVAYICPNLNVAKQNFPRLNYQESGIHTLTISNKCRNSIKQAIENYRASLRGDYPALIKFATWLENYPNDDSYIDYSRPNGHESASVDIKSSDKKSKIEKKIDDLVKEVVKAVSNDNKLFGIYLEYSMEVAKNCESKWKTCQLERRMYMFQENVAKYLINCGVHEDYRLSMQHLFSLEAKKASESKKIQIECLTPLTSFKIGDQKGNKEEKILLYSTLDYLKGINRAIVKDFYTNKNKTIYVPDDNDMNKVEWYKKRLTAIDDGTTIYNAMKSTISKAKNVNIEPNGSIHISDLRKVFIKNNLDNFVNYDLVIMDEFQNFSELIKKQNKPQNIDDEFEAYELARTLFEQENCKVLLLSATPFSVANYSISNIESDKEDQDLDERIINEDEKAIFEDFINLLKFLRKDSKADVENKWREIDEVADRQVYLRESGLFRTERLAAANHDPVIKEKNVITENFHFSNRIKINCFLKDKKRTNVLRSYINATPYPLTFGSTYDFMNFKENDNNITENYKSLFLTERQLKFAKSQNDESKNDNAHIETSNSRFELLKKKLFSVKGKNPALMLWIPPANPSKPLRGAFEGCEGYSKTLIFSEYARIPVAFTYLLCHESRLNYENTSIKNDEDCFNNHKECIKKGILRLMADTVKISEEKTKAIWNGIQGNLANCFIGIFCEEYGAKIVRTIYGKEQYPCYLQAVEQYCKDGCFGDMIKEYVELLMNEYGNEQDSIGKIRKVIDEVSGIKESRAKLKILEDDNNGKGVCSDKSDIPVANKFAMGLYSENEEKTATIKRLNDIRTAFNSPFWPFVFTTTSIGSEGIDFHWYARNIIHWSVPHRPVDLEQREGRILRYNCHAFRLNKVLLDKKAKAENKGYYCYETECIKSGWAGSGMYEKQLNYFSDEEYDGKNDGCYHIISTVFFEIESDELEKYNDAIKFVSLYRRTIGREELMDDTKSDQDIMNLSSWYHRKIKQ